MTKLDIDVSIPNPDWAAALNDAETLCRTAALAAFETVGRTDLENAEASILLTDDTQIMDLNRTYRNMDKPTNVLSFAALDGTRPFAAGPALLGDIIIAFGVTDREAANEGKTLADHLSHLVIHGMLHLLGHDHEKDEEANRMEALEIQTLAGLGIANPYNETNHTGLR